MLAAFLILKIMLTNNLKLSQINPNFTRFPQKTTNIKVEKKIPLVKLEEFNSALTKIQKTRTTRKSFLSLLRHRTTRKTYDRSKRPQPS